MAAPRNPSAQAPARLARLRLAQQQIRGGAFTDPADVVRGMLAMQAQDYAGAKWAVGLRAPGSTHAEVHAALAAGRIVRSWPMRGTLHLCAAEDLRWMLALTTPRLLTGAASRLAALDLDEATLERARAVALARLGGGKALTRGELLLEFDRAGVSTAGQRGYPILWYLAQTGTLCFGPAQDKQQTFVLLDEWIEPTRRLEPDEALGEFARRYFLGHGPATLQDFAYWTKLTLTEARTGLAVARPQLAALPLDGVSYWLAPGAEDRLAEAPPGPLVAALPGFDEYLLGYQDRGAVLAREHSQRVVPGNNGIFLPMIVVDGQVVGTWRRVARAKESVIEPVPFTRWTKAAAAGFARAAAAYGRFLGVPVRVSEAALPSRA